MIWLTIILIIIVITLTVIMIVNKTSSNNKEELGLSKEETMKSDGNEHLSVLYVQPMFIPIEPYLELNTRVLDGIENYYHQHKDSHYNVTVHIEVRGYARTDEYFDEYKTRYEEVVESCSGGFMTFSDIIREPYNYGQSYQYVKSQEFNEGKGYDMFVTNGCDLFFPKYCHPILYRSAITLNTSKQLGLLSMSMYKDNVHLYNPERFKLHKVDVMKDQPNHHFSVIYNESVHGHDIAGGLTMMRFENANEYRCTGVFSPDDGILQRQIRNGGLQTAIAHDMFVVHEFGTTASYQPFMEWKMKSFHWSNGNGENNITEEQLQPWAEESEQLFEQWDDFLLTQ